MLTTNSDQIIIYLKSGGGSINNIEGPSEVLQKFIIEQVYITTILIMFICFQNKCRYIKPKYATSTLYLTFKTLYLLFSVKRMLYINL